MTKLTPIEIAADKEIIMKALNRKTQEMENVQAQRDVDPFSNALGNKLEQLADEVAALQVRLLRLDGADV